MNFDEVLKHLGEFGFYQKRILFLASLVGLPVAWHNIGSVFLAATMDHWCSIPGAGNCSAIDMLTDGHVCQDMKMMSVPDGDEGKCSRFNISNGAYTLDYGANMTSIESIRCDRGWLYDTSQYKSSVVSEFDLVCSREDLVGYANSIYFAGILIGSLLLGNVADWIGRLPTFLICIGFTSLFGTATAFAQSYTAFVILRFFVAIFTTEMLIMVFIIGTEFIGPAHRELPGILLGVTFGLGYMMLATLAYFIRDWRYLQLAISLPVLLFFLLALIMHESARWLISQKKYKKAEKNLRKAAQVNKVSIPDKLFAADDIKAPDVSVETRRFTQIDLFRTPQMRKKTLVILFNWFVVNMAYYGVSLSTSGLGVNEYLAAFVSGAVEIPGVLVGWFTIKKFGRRSSNCGFMVIGGVACLITIFLPSGVYRTIVAMIGKFGLSASFAIIYIYSGELYPTVVRSIGMGLSSMSARVSGVISPIILLLQKYWQPLPLFIFGTFSITAGLLLLLLPETLNENLPESLQDGESFGKDSNFSLQSCISNNNDKNQNEKHEIRNGKYKHVANGDDGEPAVV